MSIEQLLPKKFPNLGTNYEITSEPADYNCMAFAVDDYKKYWWPIKHFWPKELNIQTECVEAFIECFEWLGYEKCGLNEKFEKGFQKVAIYVDVIGIPSHVAKQFPGDAGWWRSKLSDKEDIKHTLAGLAGHFDGDIYANYGNVAIILRKKASIILPELPISKTVFA